MMASLNALIKKFDELEESALAFANAISIMYLGFIEKGVPEHAALALTQYYIGKAFDNLTVTGKENDDTL